MRSDDPLTLTVEEVGRVLGVGRSTAYELIRSGDLPSLRLRRRIVVPVGPLADRLGVSAADVHASLTPTPQSKTRREPAPPDELNTGRLF